MQKKEITTTQQQEEKEAQFKVIRDHEQRNYAVSLWMMEGQWEETESRKNHKQADFEIEKCHYHEVINQLQNYLIEAMK